VSEYVKCNELLKMVSCNKLQILKHPFKETNKLLGCQNVIQNSFIKKKHFRRPRQMPAAAAAGKRQQREIY